MPAGANVSIMSTAGQVTVLLQALSEGKTNALDELHALLYDELRVLARNQLRNERKGHTLNPTALVNEAYIRLARHDAINAAQRTQFFAIAGTTMRRILVDYARMRNSKKRGEGQPHVNLDDAAYYLTDREADEVIALEDALKDLTTINKRASRVVEYRFYCGLSNQETAQLLDISSKTVQRDWLFARAWLRKEVHVALPE